MTFSDIAGTDHEDVCIANVPESCQGDCYAERQADVEGELATVRETLESPDLTIETETAFQIREDELEQELYRLTRV